MALIVACALATAPSTYPREAWGADTTSITIDNATSGTYYAYKLLDGTFAEGDTEGDAMGDALVEDAVRDVLLEALADYGYDINTSGQSERAIANDVMDALVSVESDGNAQAFANDLAGMLASAGVSPTATAKASNGTVSLTGLDQGFYLVAQKTTSSSAMTSALLMPLTSAGRTVSAKTTTPTIEKTVAGVDGEYSTTADADVTVGTGGTLTMSEVSYRIVGTVASNIEDYETYYYAFVDDLPSMLQVEDASRVSWSMTATIGETTKTITSSFACTVETVVSGDSTLSRVTWYTNDLLSVLEDAGFEDDLVSVEITLDYVVEPTAEELALYYASLSTLSDPQTNTASIEFSNNPYYGGDGSTSETPGDQTHLYTYNLSVLKVDDGGSALSGAEFTLTDSDGNEVGCNITVDDDGSFTFTGLRADTEYTLTESSVPAGYKSIDPVRFVITSNLASDGETVESIAVTVVDDPSSATAFSTEDETITVVVANLLGDDLPLTGQTGIAKGIAIGCALVACGCVLAVTTYRRSRTTHAAKRVD